MSAATNNRIPAVNPDDFEPVSLFYLANEFRRSAIWAICGCLLIAGVAWIVGTFIILRPLVDMVPLVSAMGGSAVWLSQYLLPRIRVDSAGISRRILWWWDLWTWEAFSGC